MDIPSLLDNTDDIVLNPIPVRQGLIDNYLRILVQIIRDIRKSVNDTIIPAYSRGIIPDAMVGDIGQRRVLQFSVVKSVAALSIETAGDKFRLLMDTEDRTHLLLVARSVKKHTGIDVAPSLRLSPEGVDDLVRLYINRNAALIKSLSDELVGKVEQAVFQSRIDRTTRHDLQEQLQRLYGISENRARLIATDQIGSINSDFNRSRHTALGIDSYKWRIRGDGKTRPLHVDINGTVYRWDQPTGAEGGQHAGKPIHCRCSAVAVIPANPEAVARQERLRAELTASNNEARARARREAASRRAQN